MASLFFQPHCFCFGLRLLQLIINLLTNLNQQLPHYHFDLYDFNNDLIRTLFFLVNSGRNIVFVSVEIISSGFVSGGHDSNLASYGESKSI